MFEGSVGFFGSRRSLAMLDGRKHLVSGGVTIDPGPVAVHIGYAHVFHSTETASESVSEGRTISLPGVPTNPIDAGTYGGATNYFGLSVDVSVDAIRERVKARKSD